jgi:hypothetical protein
MNKIFAIIMSFQLILAPMALAQSGGYNIPGTEESKTGVDNYQATEGTGGSEGNKQFTRSMLMTGTGAFGSTFIFCKPSIGYDSTGIPGNTIPTFSHYIFMGGAVVLLLGEIVAATKQQERKKERERQLERINKVVKPGEEATQEQKDAQVYILKEALAQEEDTRDALKQRMDWMTAAEVVYWLAVAGAATETILYFYTKTLMAASTAAKVPPIAVGYPAIYAAEKAVGYYSWGLGNCGGEKSKIPMLAIGAAYGIVGNASKGAGGAVMGGVSTAAFMYMMFQLLTTIGQPLNVAMATAPGRVGIFTIFALLADSVRKGYDKQYKRSKTNIESLQKAIADWEGKNTETNKIALDSPDTIPGTESSLGTSAGIKNQAVKNPTKTTKSGKCLSASSGTLDHSGNACRKPLKFDRSSVKFDSKFLSGVANQAFDMSESFAQDDMGGAQLQASALASNAARVKAEAMGLLKIANDEQIKNGEKPIDFDKEVKAQMASFSQMAQDAASAGGMKASGGNVATLDAEKEDKPDAVKPFVAPVAAVPARPMPNLSMGSEMPESAPAPGPAVTVQTIDDFETAEQDFSKQKDVSIFEQLSHRYFLNYSKVFERKKRPDVVIPEEVKKN